MTIEEAIEKLSNRYMVVSECIDANSAIKENIALDMAISALEAQDKYRWHDLRKDPNDLPADFYSVLICVKGFEGKSGGETIAMHNSELNIWGSCSCSYRDIEVSAWREIEPFEEVEDD